MKRTLIVAAIATLATGAAWAQSSVTLYGRLNLTMERMDNRGVKTSVLNNNASRLGFNVVILDPEENSPAGRVSTIRLCHRRVRATTSPSRDAAGWPASCRS